MGTTPKFRTLIATALDDESVTAEIKVIDTCFVTDERADNKDTFTHYIGYSDTLGEIAKKYNATSEILAKLNNMKSIHDIIHVGDTLQIPLSTLPVNMKLPTEPIRRKPRTQGNYVVQKNDTLFGLADKFKVDVKDLIKWNNFDPRNLGLYEKESINISDPEFVNVSALYGDNMKWWVAKSPILNTDPMDDSWWSYIQHRLGCSTPQQRKAAKKFALQKVDEHAVIKKTWSRSIHVTYEAKTLLRNINGVNEVIVETKNQYFTYDGTAIPENGVITATPSKKIATQNAKDWLESPSQSVGEGLIKTVANVGYSIPNSFYVLGTGKTLLTGEEATLDNKLDALTDVGTLGLLKGAKTTGVVIKTEGKGLMRYLDYVKKRGKGYFSGKGWQKDASKSFKTNKRIEKAIDNGSNALDVVSHGSNTIDREVKR